MPAESAPPRQHVRQRTIRLDDVLADSAPPQQIELIKQELRPQLTVDSIAWVLALADIGDRNGIDLHVIRRCAANLAWEGREIGQRMPDDRDWRTVAGTPSPAAAGRVLAYVHGYRLRYDFRFDQLATATRDWLASYPDDALVYSLAAFAALGQRSDRALPLLARASTMIDYDQSCRAVCLHGLWFGAHLSDQADRIIALSDEMIGRGEDDGNLYYWRAFALRRLGRFDDALISVDRAISLLPVGMNAVHQDYFRERELIGTTVLLNQHVQTLATRLGDELRAQFQQHREEMQREVDHHTRTARRVVSDSLLGIVEVLALFVTLAGFLIGSGALVLGADGFGESLAGVGLLTAGALAFFALLRAVVRLGSDRPRRWPWLRR